MEKKDLPCGSKDLGEGFVLLRAQEGEPRPLRDCEADTLQNFLPNSHLEAEICVRWWAKLRIPTGQNCYSAWKETQKLLEKHRTTCNVKVCSTFYYHLNRSLIYFQILLDDEIHLAEVYFFIHLTHEGHDLALTLVLLYSAPHPKLLEVSHNTLWLCEYQGDSSLKFINVKSIQSVVAMIPHTPMIEGQQAGEHFFLVEKPGFDVAVIGGMDEVMPGDRDETVHSTD